MKEHSRGQSHLFKMGVGEQNGWNHCSFIRKRKSKSITVLTGKYEGREMRMNWMKVYNSIEM